MSAHKEIHMIDGVPMTVDEIAEMMGFTYKQLKDRRNRMECGYQLIVTLWREGRLLRRGDRAPRHRVNGRWITIQQAADELGVHVDSIHNWRYKIKHSTGTMPTLEEAWEHFSHNNHNGGRKPRRYNVNGKRMTVPEAAKKYGMLRRSLYNYMRRHKCALAEAIRGIQENKETAAMWKIMAVLREGSGNG